MKINKQIKGRALGFLLIFLTFILINLTSCVGTKMASEPLYIKKTILPGTTKIGNNLFYDNNEVCALDWLEYKYWTKRVFGNESEEYIATLADTTVWRLIDYPCLYILEYIYLGHPAYRKYPVVGITQKQAVNYTKWRSDRVFEYILLKYDKIQWNPDQNKTNYFSIENYFNGNYNGYAPDSNFKYYPEYRLPTTQEWYKALNYADSINQLYTSKHKSKHIKECENYFSEIHCDIIPCINDTTKIDPTRPLNYECLKNNYPQIYNLRGNVSEWTSEYETCIGGGWHDTKQTIITKDTFLLKFSNAWTGFRNVCEWKEWKK